LASVPAKVYLIYGVVAEAKAVPHENESEPDLNVVLKVRTVDGKVIFSEGLAAGAL